MEKGLKNVKKHLVIKMGTIIDILKRIIILVLFLWVLYGVIWIFDQLTNILKADAWFPTLGVGIGIFILIIYVSDFQKRMKDLEKENKKYKATLDVHEDYGYIPKRMRKDV